MGSINLALLLSLVLLSIGLATALNPYCYATGNFTTNSTYGRNRDIILSSLASNVTANGGFYTATIGQGSNKVYALALCRGDSVKTDACFKCVNSSSHSLTTQCPNQKEAISWGGDPPCIIRYANRSFFGLLELSPTDAGYNINNITSNLTQFDQIYGSLMNRAITKASMGSRLKFATGDTELTGFQRIYVIMQCTPDLSHTDCDSCLRQSVSFYDVCCHGKQGGYVQKPNCFYRWDLYPFYELIADAPSPTPPPLPPKKSINSTITKENGDNASRTVIVIVVPIIVFLALVLTYALLRKRRPKQEVQAVDTSTTAESFQFDFGTVRVATGDFSDENKLGEGGFGAVYKGKLPDGQDIAVKRLSKHSRQGELEFKNEVLLVAKLQHRNLVRLLGFCLDGEERLLIYEFVPNSSLDHLIFDPIKRLLLDWEKRCKIIEGIARGILYLHEDSQLRIIHRDLKASNILLDIEMNPKISDFGMARLFAMDQTQDNTSRIVGTFGYMAPEYAMHGHFSVKSDVFSFGVLLLEIISGRKNSSLCNEEEGWDLLTHVWKNWNDGTALEIIEPILSDGLTSSSEMIRCIHIGLLCVQENAAMRPTMASVVLMLSSFSLSLQAPTKPAFFMQTSTEPNTSSFQNFNLQFPDQSGSKSTQFSVNEASISELDPR